MSRNPKLEEFEIERKPSKSYGRKNFSDNFYDPHSKTFLGRTAGSWGKILLFYAIFYSVLFALFAVCMVTFLQQFINPRVPRLQQDYGLIGTSPGLGFRPHPPDVRSTLIWYKGTGPESYKYWEDQLVEFLSDYKKKGQTAGVGQNIFKCDYRNPPPPGKVCDVDIMQKFEPCIDENHFNYHKSSPCIFLKLNKIYGWRPEYYDPSDLPADMPDQLRWHIRNTTAINSDHANQIWVSCHGETPTDQESIGKIHYIPSQGFPGYYFPYNNAEGYLSPLIAIHFEKPRGGILINVECRAYARNIRFNRREGLGVVHFELMLD